MAEQEPVSNRREIMIDLSLPEGMLGQYATNLVVQHSDQEFYIYFFQAQPPLILGPPEVQRAQVAGLETCPRPVRRIHYRQCGGERIGWRNS